MVVNVTLGITVHGAMVGSDVTLCQRNQARMVVTSAAINCNECREQAASLAKGSQGVLDALNKKGSS